MKNFFLLVIAMNVFMSYADAQLYIKGVIDGPRSGGVPKGTQVCATEAIDDLSIYGLGSANNGGGTDGQEFTFPALPANAGDCFWVASETAGFNAFFGEDPCFTSGSMGINGDDAIELFENGVVIDVYGDPDVDGNGECWEYQDGWADRSTTGPSTTFSCADWTYGSLSGSSSTNDTQAEPYPFTAQTCPALPVDFLTFSAEAEEQGVALHWATAQEINNEYFIVERSRDGDKWQALDYIKGAGDSDLRSDYEYMDKTALRGAYFYRLQQVDYDQKSSYSHTVRVLMKSTLHIDASNLIESEILVDALSHESGARYTIHSIQGAMMGQGLVDHGRIDVANLASGSYVLRIDFEGIPYTQRFIKN